MLLIRNIRLKPSDNEDIIKEKIIKRLHTKTTDFHYTIYKKSIDSRKETEYVYQVLVDIENEYIYLEHKDVSKFIKEKIEIKKVNTTNLLNVIRQCAVVGILCCGYSLSPTLAI